MGAIEDVVGGIQNTTDGQIAVFSSHGPTDDGRVKPDIVANGVEILTTDFDADNPTLTDRYTTGTNAVSGTSYSTPSLAAMVAGLQELHESLGGEPFWASSLKAIVWEPPTMRSTCRTTLGLERSSLRAPTFYGWGVANAERAAGLVHANDSRLTNPSPAACAVRWEHDPDSGGVGWKFL